MEEQEVSSPTESPGSVDETVSGETEAAEPAPQNTNDEQPQAETAPTYQLPPGYALDPATGQLVFVGPAIQQPIQPAYTQPSVVYMQPPPQPSAEQIAAEQAEAQQRYGKVINSVQQFIEGEATVSDVVKTLYANTTQDDQLWKGVIVGAAAAVLLTSEPVRDAMGKTFGGLFPGLKKTNSAESKTAADTSPESAIKDEK